jgi:hypothetical protein
VWYDNLGKSVKGYGFCHEIQNETDDCISCDDIGAFSADDCGIPADGKSY